MFIPFFCMQGPAPNGRNASIGRCNTNVPTHGRRHSTSYSYNEVKGRYRAVTKLHGKNVTLRHLTEEDFPQLLAWSHDPELAHLMEGDYPQQLNEYAQWLQSIKGDRHRQTFGIAATDGELIGDIELDHIAWRSGDAELRVRIGAKRIWGHGYGTEAVRLMLEHAFTNLNLQRVYLRVFQFNERAIASYRKAGFKKEGVLVRKTAQGGQARIVLMRILRHEFLSNYVGTEQGIAVDM